ncbi:MAG TPA: xanthine dehydrogenase family protein molybdopterin-binding subunit [Acidimicrobiales bacterium]|nr:xanthine dehydrogenase family protein molybdopterin-binding subunit [Acidimicrobiales bacterium]
MSILGNRVLRREDPKFLTVGGTYVGDLRLPGALHLAFVRSTLAHALLTSIDTTDAEAAPGVVAVYTNAGLGLDPMRPMGFLNQSMVRPLLAEGRVRYVGEPVAVVAAESPEAAADAAELVAVGYDPLPVVVDPEEALSSETILFPEAGTNVCFELSFGEDPALFEGCEAVVSARIVNQRLAPCPLEVRSAAAELVDGRLRFYASTQGPHDVRSTLARHLGLEESEVHVVAPDVGGGFGAKGLVYPEEIVVAELARRLRRPVRWTETRSESMLGLGHGRAQVQEVTIGGSRDGTISAYRLRILQESGAYAGEGAVLPFLTRQMASGVYAIAKVECSSRSVVTNTLPTVAYRGAGRPEATAAIERAVDLFAGEIGMDPAEVRRRNYIRADQFPFTTAVGTEYDSGDYERALDLALDAASYAELRAEQARRRATPGDDGRPARQLGIGISSYVEITAPLAGGEFGSVEVRPDGTVRVRTGTSPHGQGHVTAWSMIVAEQLGVPLEAIEVVHGDTDLVPRGGGTGGSRSLQLGGSAVNEAAIAVVERARSLAADLLEAAPEDVVLDRAEGRFHVAGTPAIGTSWGELAAACLEREGSPLEATSDFEFPGSTFPFGTHVSVVEVDTETGAVELVRHVSVDDAGRILNPLLAGGQIHGGIAQGAAQALLEEFVYDGEGNPLTANLADYSFVSACELPSFEWSFTETPTPKNALGVKGIGEAGTIGSTPAVHNAVCDALSHLGVRHLDMPATPVRVWEAISASRPPGTTTAPIRTDGG